MCEYVCVCVCVCVYVCMCVCVCMREPVCVYICMHCGLLIKDNAIKAELEVGHPGVGGVVGGWVEADFPRQHGETIPPEGR